MRRCALLTAFALLAVVRSLTGQTQVTAIRDLAFGAVIRGVQTTVAPSDPIKSGRLYVRYKLGGQVQVVFTLPTRLNQVAGGANMPITFATTDAIAQGTAGNSQPVTFNPNSPITFTLQTSADFYINLGGRVTPAANQATGAYQGTVVLTCTFF
jgi:hypothetical protein